MLTAGVLGTVLGDLFERSLGQAWASLLLVIVLVVGLRMYTARVMLPLYAYWLTIAIARTTGTALGDWLAESKTLGIGLPRSTLLTGAAFAIILIVWRPPRTVASDTAVGSGR
jgi:uncharacterized membrane-anchored protein